MAEEQKRKPGRPRIHPVKEKSTTGGRGPRPHVWKSGPDEYRHSIYHGYLKRKAQANFRKEGWAMTFDEFYDLWKDDWNNKGRLSINVCMSRHDEELPWTRENAYIRSRYDQLVEQAQRRREWGNSMKAQGLNWRGKPKR